MCPPTSDELRSARLQDVPLDAVQEQLSDMRARNSPVCDAEWGVRLDDGALVFHFFPPGYARAGVTEWLDWSGFRDALERALLRSFPPNTLDAGYAEELSSFFVIVKPRPQSADLVQLIERFFVDLES